MLFLHSPKTFSSPKPRVAIHSTNQLHAINGTICEGKFASFECVLIWGTGCVCFLERPFQCAPLGDVKYSAQRWDGKVVSFWTLAHRAPVDFHLKHPSSVYAELRLCCSFSTCFFCTAHLPPSYANEQLAVAQHFIKYWLNSATVKLTDKWLENRGRCNTW